MRWSKALIIIQAVATLLIGVFLLFELFAIPIVDTTDTSTLSFDRLLSQYELYRDRLFYASYVLVVVGLIEIILIWRLFDYGPIASFDSEFSLNNLPN